MHDPETERKNLLWGWGLFVLFCLLALGTFAIAFIYLAVDESAGLRAERPARVDGPPCDTSALWQFQSQRLGVKRHEWHGRNSAFDRSAKIGDGGPPASSSPGRAAGRGHPARRQGPLRHRRADDDLRLGDLRRARPDRDRRGRRGGWRRAATPTSARRTCTSSRTGRPRRTPTSAPCRTRSRRAGSPAVRAAARPPPSPPDSQTRRSAPTPAARSGSRPRAAASSA